MPQGIGVTSYPEQYLRQYRDNLRAAKELTGQGSQVLAAGMIALAELNRELYLCAQPDDQARADALARMEFSPLANGCCVICGLNFRAGEPTCYHLDQ